MKHVAYADDIAGSGKLQKLKTWWDKIMEAGPKLGYFPKASKSWLGVKENMYDSAVRIFNGTGVNITSQGRKYLGGVIGSNQFTAKYKEGLVGLWKQQIEKLADIAKCEPQADLASFTCGLKHRFTYYLRSIPDMENFMQPVEDAIRFKLIPNLTDGHHCSDNERLLLSLPPRLGGLGIPILTKIASEEYQFSKMVTKPLSMKIHCQEKNVGNIETEIKKKKKNEIRRK